MRRTCVVFWNSLVHHSLRCVAGAATSCGLQYCVLVQRFCLLRATLGSVFLFPDAPDNITRWGRGPAVYVHHLGCLVYSCKPTQLANGMREAPSASSGMRRRRWCSTLLAVALAMSLSAAQAGLLVEAPKKGRPVDVNAAQPWTIPFPDAPELLEYDNGYEIKEDLYAKYQERRLQELSGFLTRMQEKLKKRELTVGVLMPERPELGPIITAFRRLGAKIEGIPKKNYQSDMSHMFRHELLVSYAYQPRKYWRRLTGGNHTLVVEKAYFRGKIKGRYEQSYSWDGVNNRGLHPTGHGGRWSAMRKVLRPKPWKRVCPKTVLLLGQERFDRTQYPIRRRYGSSSAFIQSMINRLKEKAPSLTILFRAHPEEIKKSGGKYFRPYGAKDVSKEDFMKTMARSQLVVTGNSGAAVEAMLMGIPVLAGDVGFMGWQCSLHRIDELSSMNLRSHDECFHQIAVSQWSATDLLRGGLPYIMNPAHYQFATQQPPPSQFNVTCGEL